MKLLFPFAIITAYSLSIAASQRAVPCAPLASYVDPKYEKNLDIFLGGGAIPNDVPVFFDVPRMETSSLNPQIKLCVEDLPIPTSVGEVECDGYEKCWLVIGQRTDANADPRDTRTCTCSGADFGSGSTAETRTLTDACGAGSDETTWSTLCPDIYNRRMIFPYDGTNYSNHSSVQINTCGGIGSYCDMCRGGGYQPQLRVGLTWMTTSEQCFSDSPFTSGASPSRTIVGMTAASSFAAGFLFLLACM